MPQHVKCPGGRADVGPEAEAGRPHGDTSHMGQQPRLAAALAVLAVAFFTFAVPPPAPKTVSITGTLSSMDGESFVDGTPVEAGTTKHAGTSTYVVDTGRKLVNVSLPGTPPLGKKVVLRGTYLRTSAGRRFVATSADPVSAAASPYAPSSGTVKVAVLLYN